MEKYKVLWIDDNPADELREEAFVKYGIDLVCKESYSDGIKWLSENLTTCDAVILDVYCKDENDETPNFESFRANINKINYHCTQNGHFIPWFVYTGGPSGTQRGYAFIDNLVMSNPREWDDRPFYNKPTDRLNLFQRIIDEAGKSETTKIKHKYQSVFLIDDSIHNELINIISRLESDNNCDRDYEVIRSVAVVIEKIRDYLVKIGFLPKELADGIQISKCANFLGRQEMESLIPSYIQQNFYACVKIGSEGGHDLPARNDVENGNAPYLVKSVIYALLSLLHWVSMQETDKRSVDERILITTEAYKTYCSNKASDIDTIINEYNRKELELEIDEEGIVHCGKCETHAHAAEKKGRLVKLSAIKVNSSPHKKKYPIFAQRYDEIKQ